MVTKWEKNSETESSRDTSINSERRCHTKDSSPRETAQTGQDIQVSRQHNLS
jgi:hypothetical protein